MGKLKDSFRCRRYLEIFLYSFPCLGSSLGKQKLKKVIRRDLDIQLRGDLECLHVIIKHLKINIQGNKIVKKISFFISEKWWIFPPPLNNQGYNKIKINQKIIKTWKVCYLGNYAESKEKPYISRWKH